MKKVLVMICALGLATTVACGDEESENNTANNTSTNNTATNNTSTNNTSTNNTATNNTATNNTATNNAATNNTATNNTSTNNTATNNNTMPTTCEEYCTTFAANCATDFAADYTDEAGCLTECAAFAPGDEGATEGDSAECRLYHATAASTDDIHCTHSKLAPDSICVDPM